MRKESFVFFLFLISLVSGIDSDEERDRMMTAEKERVWPRLRNCCERSLICPDKSEMTNYFKCKEELGKCMDIRVEDLKGDAVDGCDLIYAEKK